MPPVVLFAIALLNACASNGPASPFKDSFVTEISANGTKFFTYTRQFNEGSKSQSHRTGNDAETSLQKSIREKLESSGYCRDGYLALEDYEANGIARIRGECRDGASASDRTMFPNPR